MARGPVGEGEEVAQGGFPEAKKKQQVFPPGAGQRDILRPRNREMARKGENTLGNFEMLGTSP